MGGKTILLYDLNERENALELAFQPRYGDIVSYRWFGNGFIIAGFSSGYVVIISTRKLRLFEYP
jgi:WD repeat-containing protein 19